MKAKPIGSTAEYEEALERVYVLMDAQAGQREREELQTLSLAIQDMNKSITRLTLGPIATLPNKHRVEFVIGLADSAVYANFYCACD
jgi:hypothetical protein